MTDSTQPARCKSVGDLLVGGVVVGHLKCDRDEGHASGEFPRLNYIERRGLTGIKHFFIEATPHRAVLEWHDDAAIDWPEALDPDESFDIEVELVTPPIPDELCGVGGCVFLRGHAQPPSTSPGQHSWDV